MVVSTPQDVALIDARKGVGMFNKVSIPVRFLPTTWLWLTTKIIGLLLNMSHYTCASCSTPHELFGSPDKFAKAASDLHLPVLGECVHGFAVKRAQVAGNLPLVTSVSDGGDAGRPVMVQSSPAGEEVRQVMRTVGQTVWDYLASRPQATLGARG